VWAQVIVPPVLVFAALAAFMAAAGHGPAAMLTDDRPGGADGIPFVPLFEVTTEWQHYTMFSLAHVLDWVNEHFLISPFGLLLLVCALVALVAQRVGGKVRDGVVSSEGGITPFLTIASAAYLLLTFVWNPDYGMRKDWDLFAPSAFVYTVLAGHLLTRHLQTSATAEPSDISRSRQVLARNAVLLIVAAALHTGAWVYSNTIP
jgi:hypothetical protein